MSNKISNLGATQAKETIYVDIDDEITSIIDRVTSSKAKIIALVLPKRATVLQSIVNMKLLKHVVETADKHLVLITSETGLLPLAGMVGLHVAATPTSKPEIPEAPGVVSDEPDSVDEGPLKIIDNTSMDADDDFDKSVAATTPVGVLADTSAEEPILMANEQSDEDLGTETLNADETAEQESQPVRDKSLKVPSFNKFRLWLILGVLLLIIIGVGSYFAMIILPKAGIAITTNSTTVTTNLNLTLDTKAQSVDATNSIIPAVAQTVTKTYSQDASTTGQKNTGQKASGTVYFALTDCASESVNIPAGSGVSVGGNTYITQAKIALVRVIVQKGSDTTCNPADSQSYWSDTTKVVAIAGGVKFNADSGTTVAIPSSITGAASLSAKVNQAITGGTDNIIKIVAQTDIDGAKSKLVSSDNSAVQSELQTALNGKGLMPVQSTMITGDQQVTSSVNAGDQADTVKVTVTVPYTMLGVKQEDLKTLVMKQVDAKIDPSKQHVTDDGVAKAVFSQQTPGSAISATVAAKVRSTAGPSLDAAQIRNQVAGKKAGDIKSTLGNIPGVTDVQVAYSPFWVNSVPKDIKKITVIIDGQTK